MTESLDNQKVDLEQEKMPQSELSVEKVEKDCASVINNREIHLKKAVKEVPENEGMRQALVVHNKIVLDYAVDIANMLELDDREKAIAMVATILHDSAKLDDKDPVKALVNHHTMGAEVSTEIAKKFVGETVNGYEVTEDMVPDIANAVRRHQNHPFLVTIFNKGKRFEEPQTKADQVVYLADMMANIGFKNIIFRILPGKFPYEDVVKSVNDGDDHLNVALDNVFQGKLGVANLVQSVFYDNDGKRLENLEGTEKVEEYMTETIESAKKIYDQLKIELPKLEKEMTVKSPRSGGELYSHSTWQAFAEAEGMEGKTAGVKFMAFKINKLIDEIGRANGIDQKIVNNFKM